MGGKTTNLAKAAEDDIWRYDFRTRTWADLTEGRQPESRCLHSAATRDKNNAEPGRPTISSQSPRSERGTVRSARSPLCFHKISGGLWDSIFFSQIRPLYRPTLNVS